MVAPCQWFTHSFLLALKLLTAYVHRSTLPQSRIRSTAPSEREPGTPSSSRVPFNVSPGNREVAGDFHRPYETQKPFPFTIHRTALPQSRIRSTAPSEREPGRGGCHSTCRPETGTLRAIFIAPTKLKNRFPLPFIGRHSLSLAFARQLPQGGSRERHHPAGYHSTCRPETARLRAIFIAPTELKNRFPLPFIGGHSLSLAFARQLPQRGSREWAVPFNPPKP